jgi:hypothetical protein
MSVALVLGVVVASCVWVSAVRFKDRHINCGTPISSAQHGVRVPWAIAHPDANNPAGSLGVEGFGFDPPPGTIITVCRGEARARCARVAVAAAVMPLRVPDLTVDADGS